MLKQLKAIIVTQRKVFDTTAASIWMTNVKYAVALLSSFSDLKINFSTSGTLLVLKKYSWEPSSMFPIKRWQLWFASAKALSHVE